jgi:Trk K+ transport system NAD-binding subunit
VKQFKVLDRNPFLNREYSKVFFDLKREYRAILVGISREMNGKYMLKKNPADGTIILAGDYLLVIANRVVAEKLSKLFGVKEGVN